MFPKAVVTLLRASRFSSGQSQIHYMGTFPKSREQKTESR